MWASKIRRLSTIRSFQPLYYSKFLNKGSAHSAILAVKQFNQWLLFFFCFGTFKITTSKIFHWRRFTLCYSIIWLLVYLWFLRNRLPKKITGIERFSYREGFISRNYVHYVRTSCIDKIHIQQKALFTFTEEDLIWSFVCQKEGYKTI